MQELSPRRSPPEPFPIESSECLLKLSPTPCFLFLPPRCTTSGTWSVRVVGKASAHDAQNAHSAHLVAPESHSAHRLAKLPMPSPHQCLAFVGTEFPLSATCLGRELSHSLQSDLDAWCASCVWPWGSHFPPIVATRAASQARTEWSSRVGAPPRSCCASSLTRTPRCLWVFPKLPSPLAAKLQAPTHGRPPALFSPCSTPWFPLVQPLHNEDKRAFALRERELEVTVMCRARSFLWALYNYLRRPT